MDTVIAPPMTVEQFLAWEEEQEERWEFDGERPVEVNGGTRAHNLIVLNLATAVRARLDRSRFEVFALSMKVQIGNRIRYPDVLVTVQSAAMTATVDKSPVVVFEVLSPSTAHADRGSKRLEYQSADTARRYVMLQQTRLEAIVFARSAAGDWDRLPVTAPGAVLAMPEIGIDLPMAEIYAGVFPALPQ